MEFGASGICDFGGIRLEYFVGALLVSWFWFSCGLVYCCGGYSWSYWVFGFPW